MDRMIRPPQSTNNKTPGAEFGAVVGAAFKEHTKQSDAQIAALESRIADLENRVSA